jgi:hypothetical protein
LIDSEAARAATAPTVNGPRKFAHMGQGRNFFAATSRTGCHSRPEVQAGSSAVDAWEPLGKVLQRLLSKWEETHHHG